MLHGCARLFIIPVCGRWREHLSRARRPARVLIHEYEYTYIHPPTCTHTMITCTDMHRHTSHDHVHQKMYIYNIHTTSEKTVNDIKCPVLPSRPQERRGTLRILLQKSFNASWEREHKLTWRKPRMRGTRPLYRKQSSLRTCHSWIGSLPINPDL